MRDLTAADKIACRAFALCRNPATGAFAHPVLNWVLSCQRCATKLEAELLPVEIHEESSL